MSFDKLCGIAIARLGLTVRGFYDLTPIEFHYAIEQKNEMEIMAIQKDYEVARYLSMNIYNANNSRLKRLIQDPKKMGEFLWEKPAKEEKPQTVEDHKYQLQSIARFFSKNSKGRNKE